MDHKHYRLCYNAHRNTSHFPEDRAKRDCAAFDEDVAQVTSLGGDIARLEKLFLAWKSAQSRCASPVIVGPARFPVARQEKARASERKHSSAYCDYINRLIERKRLADFYLANPHARPISSDDADALPRLKEKLAAQMADHEAMIAANKAQRGAHQPFELANSNARIKSTRDRIDRMEKAATRRHQEVKCDGFTVIQNVEANRVQIRFDDRPTSDVCETLKGLAFRYAPSLGVWQRQLTNAGIYAAKQFMAESRKTAPQESQPNDQ